MGCSSSAPYDPDDHAADHSTRSITAIGASVARGGDGITPAANPLLHHSGGGTTAAAPPGEGDPSHRLVVPAPHRRHTAAHHYVGDPLVAARDAAEPPFRRRTRRPAGAASRRPLATERHGSPTLQRSLVTFTAAEEEDEADGPDLSSLAYHGPASSSDFPPQARRGRYATESVASSAVSIRSGSQRRRHPLQRGHQGSGVVVVATSQSDQRPATATSSPSTTDGGAEDHMALWLSQVSVIGSVDDSVTAASDAN